MGVPTARWSRRSLEHDVSAQIGEWRSFTSRAEYEASVRAVQEGIADGDIYQVNITQRFAADFAGNPYALFEHLLARSPAPGGAFIDTGLRQIPFGVARTVPPDRWSRNPHPADQGHAAARSRSGTRWPIFRLQELYHRSERDRGADHDHRSRAQRSRTGL